MEVQIVITTILGVLGLVTLGSLIWRMGNLDDNLWIEPVIAVVLVFFAYLLWK